MTPTGIEPANFRFLTQYLTTALPMHHTYLINRSIIHFNAKSNTYNLCNHLSFSVGTVARYGLEGPKFESW